MRSTFEILEDLSRAWAKMGDEERVTVGNAIAGVNQYKVLAAVMQNFDSAIKANETAMNAQGSAIKENERYMQSFEAQVNGLKAAWQNLSTAVVDGGFVKGAISAITSVVNALSKFPPAIMAIQTLLAGGAIWGGFAVFKALDLGSVTAQFTKLGSAIASAAAQGGGLSAAIAGVGGASAVALPIILAVTAAAVGLGAAYKAIRQAQYEKSYDGITEAISKEKTELDDLQDTIGSYESRLGSLTQAERDYLDVLIQQRDTKQQKILEDQQKAWGALEKEVGKASKGIEVFYDEQGRAYYENKVEKAVLDFAQQVKNGERYTESYKQGLKDFVSTWQDYAVKLKEAEAAGYSLSDSSRQFLDYYDLVSNELEDISKAFDEVDESISNNIQSTSRFKESYKDVKTGIEEATSALEKFKNATAYDYTSAISGYKSAFQELKKGYTAGTLNVDQLSAGIELFFGEDKKAELNYDLNKYSEELGKLFSGNLSKVFATEDPMQGFVNAIMQSGGTITTESGKIAASINSDNELTIKSYSALAEWLGTTEEVARALMGQIQATSGQFVFADEDIRNLATDLSKLNIDSAHLFSGTDLVEKIKEITGATDPEQIMAYVDALKEIGAVSPDVKVDADTIEAVNNVEEVSKAEEGVKDKKVTINTLVNGIGDLQTAQGLINGINSKTAHVNVYVTTHEKTVTVGGRKATGTESAEGGATLVNDGLPVNGSSAEAIISDGRMYIAGQGEETITNLNHGDKVLNAADTQALLRKSGLKEEDLYGGIQSFATGTTHINVSPYIGGGGNYNPAASGTATLPTSNPAVMKAEFDKWLKEKKHYLAMDMITEEEYYRDLEKMIEKYLKGRKEYLEEYWRYQEEIYNYQKKKLKEVIDLEEKLNELAKAKTQKVLVYKDGMFQYIQNTEAISRAQTAVNGYADGTLNARGGLNLVGEEGPELRVLNSGDGVIPADVTRNLMKIGKYGNMGATGKTITDIFNIGTIKLEKINDVEGLFDGLKNLAIQKTAAKA